MLHELFKLQHYLLLVNFGKQETCDENSCRRGTKTVILETRCFDNIDSAVIISSVNFFHFALPSLRC